MENNVSLFKHYLLHYSNVSHDVLLSCFPTDFAPKCQIQFGAALSIVLYMSDTAWSGVETTTCIWVLFPEDGSNAIGLSAALKHRRRIRSRRRLPTTTPLVNSRGSILFLFWSLRSLLQPGRNYHQDNSNGMFIVPKNHDKVTGAGETSPVVGFV